MWVYKFNDEFIWEAGEEILIDEGEEIPTGYTDIQPPNELYKAKFDPKTKTWSEAATQEYIDSFQPDPLPPDDVTLLKKHVALLTLQLSQMQKGGAS
ncbi:hypothetical protein US8_00029 [Bacillus altitudinis]|uniref:hypothetical protein n=1 Tax=Bacillus altitudinis TaxID=293387 RepID=UPI000D7CBABD|nr:hypothetical protein [Bacillus altitudinis]PYH27407.1 hypothetical protein US8_00029 [Bacillus altitudinis]